MKNSSKSTEVSTADQSFVSLKQPLKSNVKKSMTGTPNYMIYQGKTKHCCRGRCILGSIPKWSVFSLCFYNIPPALLYATIAPVSP